MIFITKNICILICPRTKYDNFYHVYVFQEMHIILQQAFSTISTTSISFLWDEYFKIKLTYFIWRSSHIFFVMYTMRASVTLNFIFLSWTFIEQNQIVSAYKILLSVFPHHSHPYSRFPNLLAENEMSRFRYHRRASFRNASSY